MKRCARCARRARPPPDARPLPLGWLFSPRPFSPPLPSDEPRLTTAPLSSYPPRSDALELSDAFGLALVSGVSSSKRSRMEDQMFGKMGALTLTLDISNGASSSGAVARRSAREDRAARRARGQKRAGVTYKNGVAHVRLDLGATGATGATSVWDQIARASTRRSLGPSSSDAPPRNRFED